MEAIIGIIVVFWILSYIFGLGKNQQGQGPGQGPRRRMPGGMPPFGSGGPDMRLPPIKRTQHQPGHRQEGTGSSTGWYDPSARVEEPMQTVYTSKLSTEQDDPSYHSSGEQSGTEPAVQAQPAYRTSIDPDRLSRAADLGSDPSSQQAAYRSSDSVANVNRISPSQNEVVNAVIWSEILGPPRARRRIR